MGWNTVKQTASHPIFDGIEDESEFYFVHSFYPAPADNAAMIGQTDYADVLFASAAAKDSESELRISRAVRSVKGLNFSGIFNLLLCKSAIQ